MNRPKHNREFPENDFPEDAVHDDAQVDFSYLDEGAIMPPPRKRMFPRTSTRRGFIAAGVAAIGATAWFGVPLNTEGAFFPGTMVGTLNIAELDHPQALALMKAHFADFENTAVDFDFEDQTWNASLNQLGFSIDYESTLAAAWQHGRESGRLAQFKAVMIQPERQSYPVLFTSDDEKLRDYLTQLGTQIKGAARDASLYLDGDQVRIQPNEDGRELDVEAAAAATRRIVQGAERGVVALTAQPVISQITAEMLEPKRDLAQTMISGGVDINTGDDVWRIQQSKLREALVLPEQGVLTDPTFDERIIGDEFADMAVAVKTDPKDATLGWSDGLTVIEADVRGRTLNIPSTVQEVIAAAKTTNQRTVNAQYEDVLAEVRADNLDELGITGLLATGDSNFVGSSWERAENVRVSADHLTHTLVRPGETYSFNDSIGRITLENGFVQGMIIQGSRIVEDIGGGACQASTTVFRAALKAGLPIEHHFHTFRLAMYEHDGWPPGLDAAIFQPEDPNDWDTDLFFTNNTDNWLLVEFEINDTHAYCSIYGTPPGYEVEIEVPYISEPKKPEGPIETEDPALDRGERQQVGWPTDGYEVQAIRRVMKDGELVQMEGLPNPWEFWSFFDPQRETWLIGPGTKRQFDDKDDDDTTPTPGIENGN